jgi:3-methyladenine DNA glycosylase AlkD
MLQMSAKEVQEVLRARASAADAVFLQRFFKTGPGQYGESDVFIGVRVPQTRIVCKQFRALPLVEIQKLLASPVHEHRLAALIIMTLQYPSANDVGKRALYELYVENLYGGNINNWDLVDASAEHIVGPYLANKPKDILYELARSKDVWQRRVAILSTFAYIKQGKSEITLKIAAVLLRDPHDLIQKAVGWMLRELGKRVDEKILTNFLDLHAAEMPRTMLRYAIERLTLKQRLYYMKLK